MKRTLKLTLYLLLRYIMIALLCFLTLLLAEQYPLVLYPILGVFYLVAALYYIIFTSWHEGGKDIAYVNSGSLKKNLGRGFYAFIPIIAIIVFFDTVPLWLYNLLDAAVKETVVGVMNIVNVFFMMPHWYLAELPTLYGADTVFWRYFIHFTLLGVYLICSGTAYIVGFKRIKIISPWLDKWKRN